MIWYLGSKQKHDDCQKEDYFAQIEVGKEH